MAIEKDFFRQVMGRFVTGVTVVTTHHNGTPAGLTVNAFCSVSLSPPLVLVCVDLTSSVIPLIRESGIYAVNMLTTEQEAFSRCFASPTEERHQHFCYANYYTAATGAPILEGAHAFIDTHIVAEYPGGDHIIFVGQIEAMGAGGQVAFADASAKEDATLVGHEEDATSEESLPLGYYRGQYRQLADGYRQPSLSTIFNAKQREQQEQPAASSENA